VAGPLTGTRVLELSSGDFAAATGALLGDWGADVIKLDRAVEPRPEGALDSHLNRNKRSVAADPTTAEGADVVRRLVTAADVFLTDLTPAAAAELDLAPESLAAYNRPIVYARGTALGPRGPERDRRGDDFTAYWARGGLATTFQLADASLVRPTEQPVPGFGALPAAAMLAGGIAAALYGRVRTGEPVVVDASLLGLAAFNLATDVAAEAAGPAMQMVRADLGRPSSPGDRTALANALVCFYRTGDGRFICVNAYQDRFFPDICARLGRPHLSSDPRFATHHAREEHSAELVRELDAAFAQRSLAEWARELVGTEWVWEPIQTLEELVEDGQFVANRLLLDRTVVSGPVHFDQRVPTVSPAPMVGQHTAEVLAELEEAGS
jgi:crotonobetainyl-CoA:carnitine CoA-transferase CaiB-like acyl-CoA transferase